jgi:hypothetical protein
MTALPTVIARRASAEAIQLFACFTPDLDCFAEPVIGRRHSASKTRVNALLAPTRWLAMTMGKVPT